ncbi:ABC transporter permease [Xylocopilactobacillus apicola]|nr:ABC transporter permease [Xylocopilactobacillus apicola]
MFKILLHKNLKDFKSNFSEFFSIFILSLISILVFAGLYSASNGMKHEFNSWAQSSKMADEWVTVKGTNSNDIHKLLKKKSVNDVQKQYVFNSYTGSTKSKKMLQTVVINNNKISKPDIVSGKKISFETEGVWLDEEFAKSNKYHVGDYIELDSGNGKESFEIKGLVVSPNYIGYTGPNNIISDHKKYGYVITNTKTMPVSPKKFNQVLVTKNKGYSEERLQKDTRNSLSTKVISLVDRNSFNNVSKFINKYKSIKKMAVMFSLILFMLVLMVTQTTISRLVSNQRNIIGLFRALGLKKISIVAHYSVYGVISTFLGGLAGAFLGMEFISKLILSKQEPLFGIPVWQARNSNLTWIILGVLVLISLMASIWKVMQILRSKTAEILQKETIASSSKNIFEYFPNFWSNLRWNWKWVLRDKSRARSKELIGVIGIVGSLILLIASIGIQQSLNKTNHETYTNVFQYKTELKVSPLKHQEAFRNLKNKLGDDSQEIEQTALNIRTSQGEVVNSGNIISKGIYLKLPLESNRTVDLQAKKGVYVTNFVAKKLHIKTGDNIEINSAAMGNKKIVPIL